MKKIIIVIGALFFFLVVAGYSYVAANPPLVTPGMSWDNHKPTERVVEIQNEGYFSCYLQEVRVDGRVPIKVELGVSRSGHMVLGAGLDEDPDITFHSIDSYPIVAKRRIDILRKQQTNAIQHYGIRVTAKEVPTEVVIKYKYLGFPFTIEVDVDN